MKRTPAQIDEQIERAVKTISHMPKVELKNRFCNWPDVIHSVFELYSTKAEANTRPRIKPNAKDLAELDEVIIWLTWLDKEISRVIWARHENFSWRDIGKMVGVSDKTAKSYAMAGVLTIAHRINHGQFKKIQFRRKNVLGK